MGSLVYGTADGIIEFDDRVLAHLQLVICAKLRRSESLTFTFLDRLSGGRRTIFLSNAIPLQFHYSSETAPAMNREWLEELSMLANSASGLRIVEERIPVAASDKTSVVSGPAHSTPKLVDSTTKR